jgi:hypothetical protein
MEKVNNSGAIHFAGPENGVRKSSHIIDVDNFWSLPGKNFFDYKVDLGIPQIYKMPDGFEEERLVLCSITPIDVPRIETIHWHLIHDFFTRGAKRCLSRTRRDNKNLMTSELQGLG